MLKSSLNSGVENISYRGENQHMLVFLVRTQNELLTSTFLVVVVVFCDLIWGTTCRCCLRGPRSFRSLLTGLLTVAFFEFYLLDLTILGCTEGMEKWKTFVD